MAQLLDTTPLDIRKGDHVLTFRANGGTGQLQYSIDGLAMADVPDSTYSADTDEVKTLCYCKVQAVLTGSATMHITEAGNN